MKPSVQLSNSIRKIILANTLGLPRLAISFILYLHFKLTLKQLKLVTFDPSQDWLQMVVRLFTAKTLEFWKLFSINKAKTRPELLYIPETKETSIQFSYTKLFLFPLCAPWVTQYSSSFSIFVAIFHELLKLVSVEAFVVRDGCGHVKTILRNKQIMSNFPKLF